MILDSGICTIFRRTDAAQPGAMPVPVHTPIFRSWYGELDFETSPVWQTDGRKSLQADARIRVLQNREIRQHDVVILRELEDWPDPAGADTVYQITRAYHGTDDDGPTPITDLTLEVVQP